ncbi:MAG: hypothetical protein ACI91V_000204 [Lentimonas sp.]|jgi:hypothetical protein
MNTYPKTFSHIGLSVPNLEKARGILRRGYGMVYDHEAYCCYRGVRFRDRQDVY